MAQRQGSIRSQRSNCGFSYPPTLRSISENEIDCADGIELLSVRLPSRPTSMVLQDGYNIAKIRRESSSSSLLTLDDMTPYSMHTRKDGTRISSARSTKIRPDQLNSTYEQNSLSTMYANSAYDTRDSDNLSVSSMNSNRDAQQQSTQISPFKNILNALCPCLPQFGSQDKSSASSSTSTTNSLK